MNGKDHTPFLSLRRLPNLQRLASVIKKNIYKARNERNMYVLNAK